MTEHQAHPPLPPVKIAFILDGKVQEILHTDTRLGAIFLSDPILVDVTNRNDVGMYFNYDETTQTFSQPTLDENGDLA